MLIFRVDEQTKEGRSLNGKIEPFAASAARVSESYVAARAREFSLPRNTTKITQRFWKAHLPYDEPHKSSALSAYIAK
jgi:hypothetical protein